MFTLEIGIKTDHGLIKWYELKTLLMEILQNYELFTNPLRGDSNSILLIIQSVVENWSSWDFFLCSIMVVGRVSKYLCVWGNDAVMEVLTEARIGLLKAIFKEA